MRFSSDLLLKIDLACVFCLVYQGLSSDCTFSSMEGFHKDLSLLLDQIFL